MLRRQILIFVLSAVAVVAFAVQGYQYWNRPRAIRLVLTTGQPGGTYFPLGQLIATSVEGDYPRLTIDVVQSQGSGENMERLADKSADLAIIQNDTIPQTDVRTLIPLHRGVLHFLVHESAGITSLADLRGKQVAIGPLESGTLMVTTELLRHFGIEEDEFVPVYEGVATAGEKLRRQEIDALLFMAAVDASAARELITDGGVRYVSLSENYQSAGSSVDGFALAFPYVEKFIIPQNLHPMIDDSPSRPLSPCATFSLRSSLVAREDLPTQVAHDIVQAILENRAVMTRENQSASEISEQFGHRDVHYPLHAGADAYFHRSDPTFLERYAEPMAFGLSLLAALYAMFAGARNWLMRSKKNRVDVYYSRLDELLSEMSEADPNHERLDDIEHEVMDMRRAAVRELVDEQLQADDSFLIFQSLLDDCHRQIEIRRRRLDTKEA